MTLEIQEIREIKILRKKYGLTQMQLAKLANVSQSLIAKIEGNNIDPAYSKVRKLLDVLSYIQNKNELKAKDILNKNIVYISPSCTLKDATSKLKKYEISQLPVVENGKVIGLVSEAIILDALLSKESPSGKVKQVMQDAPPVISPQTSITVFGHLLKYYPLIIVSEKGKTLGVITKADMLRRAYK